MKKLQIIILSLVCIATFHSTALAGKTPVLIEIFTHSGSGCAPITEDEFHNADGSHKSNVNEHHDHGHKDTASIKYVEDTFKAIIAENPNIIALNYQQKHQPHIHDEHGNDIILDPIDIDESLNAFIQERNFLYYKQYNFLEQYADFQMVIGGTYRTSGTMKHIANAAVKKYASEEKPTKIKLAIKGQNLKVKLPETVTEKDISLTLISYTQKPEMETQHPLLQTIPTPNVVTGHQKLTAWNGQALKLTIPIEDEKADGFVLIAQDQKTAKIYAIGQTEK